ncbi:flagellar brake domain-containing protein [Aminivibrio sp.]
MKPMEPAAFLGYLNTRIGAKAMLSIDAGLYKGIYPSRIEDVKEGMIALSHPLLKGALLPVLRSVQLKLKVEADEGIFQAEAAVARGFPQGGIPLLWVTPVSEALRVQRRYFVRVPCLLKTGLFRIEGDQLQPDRELWREVTATDISLGGIGFTVFHPQHSHLLPQDRYLINIALQDRKFFLTGKIVKKIESAESAQFGISFDSLPGCVEKILSSFIRQQELAGRQTSPEGRNQ